MGYVTASLPISKLQEYPRQNRLARLLKEHGRLAKTITHYAISKVKPTAGASDANLTRASVCTSFAAGSYSAGTGRFAASRKRRKSARPGA